MLTSWKGAVPPVGASRPSSASAARMRTSTRAGEISEIPEVEISEVEVSEVPPAALPTPTHSLRWTTCVGQTRRPVHGQGKAQTRK